MSKHTGVKNYILFSILLACFAIFAQASFAGCDTNYFKISHRKLTSFFPADYYDWNDDGFVDFWRPVLNSGTGKTEIFVYPGNGTGDWNFNSPTVYTTDITGSLGNIGTEYRLVDFNNDGKTDIIDFTRRNVYQDNGSGSLVALTPYFFPDEQFPQIVAVVDVNADNIPDLITTQVINVSQNTTGYRLGNSNGTFGSRVILLNDKTSIKPADFDGDGDTDLLAYKGSGGTFRVLFKNGKGGFTTGAQIEVNPGPNFQINVSDVGDLNNDDKADIVLSLGRTSPTPLTKLMVLYSNGDGSFTNTEYAIFRPEQAGLFKIGEFNGDSNPDIIGHNDESFYSIHINNGSGSFTRHDYTKPFGPVVNPTFVDLNGDGRDDLFSSMYYSQFPSNPFGQYVFYFYENTCQLSGTTTRADLDGDGAADIVRWNPSSGVWKSLNAKWLGQSTGTPVKSFTWGLGSLGDVPALGDYDGDGITDYGVYRNSTGYWYIYQSSNATPAIYGFGLPGDIAVPNDYDGGGKTDIAVFRPSDGNWYVFFSETQSFYIVHFGMNGDKAAPADYDGDGKTDIAVYRPSNGLWFYLRSSDGNWGGASWGLSTDTPLPGDYDGDGKADITVIRDPGDWYIMRSTDGSFNLFHWGTTGDTFVPFYRYPGSAEFVAYRPSQWLWYSYFYRDFGNASVIEFGGFGDVAVQFGLPNN